MSGHSHRPLTGREAAEQAPAGWWVDDGTLTAGYRTGSMVRSVQFVDAVTAAAEAAEHHPDVEIHYGTVRFVLTTHDAGGLTDADVGLALMIAAIALEWRIDPVPPPADRTLRLVWPQWQGAGQETVAELLPEVALERARRGYAVGAQVLDAVLPSRGRSTAHVVVDDEDEPVTEGIESRGVLAESLEGALDALARNDFDRVVTIGGDCSVSIAPFAALAERYGDDLAVVWLDAHPDVGTPDSAYPGFHAMAAAVLTGHGDAEMVELLPATVPAERMALAGLHEWTDDDFPNIADWQLASFGPEALATSTAPLLDWLRSTGAGKVAIHLDVDVVDADEAVLGLGQVRGGLSTAQVRRVIDDVAGAAEVVGVTIAEFIPRNVLAAQRLLDGLPLL
ncbi:putative hydrolase [Gordonia hirsuta DSM 44140 = NBRC 16056]|uniref:Putative pterin-4-alpha-carbinolamine dehydratase n=1 Tax=Gordonia hirsuta DSM 44140 = NBRC 16056 TaxID=1121927 RepID=L7L9L3_9ACTN|nr:arginase family protein [Gordonia hirsuta]GAC57604.1 putative hydrolase [Gordonia hirsuta DSM 44140 = NBRC 16056]